MSTRFWVVAPGHGSDGYVIRERISGNRGQLVRDELAEATGNPHSRATGVDSRAQWEVTEEFSQGAIERFCDGYVQRYESLHEDPDQDQDEHRAEMRRRGAEGQVEIFGIQVPGGSPYDALYHRLRGDPNQEQRAHAIAEFLEATGQQGVNLIRHGAHASNRQVVTRLDENGHPDPNFMTLEQRRQLNQSIQRWTEQIEEAQGRNVFESQRQSEVLVAQIQSQLEQVQQRRAALDEHGRYGDLPRQERAEIITLYEQYIDRLQQLLSRARSFSDAEIARLYGEETQRDFQAMERNRDRARQLADDIEETRRFSIMHRRHFGQAASEDQEARLGERAQQLTSDLWRRAEANRAAAEREMRVAEDHMGETRHQSEHGQRFEGTMQDTYRRAREDFGRAVEAYEQAEELYTQLNRTYADLRANEHEDQGGTPATPPEGANRASPPDEEAEPEAEEHEPSPPEEHAPSRERHAHRRRPRHRASERHASGEHEESASESESESPESEDESEQSSSGASRRQLAPVSLSPYELLIEGSQGGGVEQAGRHPTVDRGPVVLDSGLTVQAVRVRWIPAHQHRDSPLYALLQRRRRSDGPGELYLLEVEITNPAPGIATFRSGNQIIVNRAHERFRQVVFAPD